MGKFLINENLKIHMISDDEITPDMSVTEIDLYPVAKYSKTYTENLTENLKKIVKQIRDLEVSRPNKEIKLNLKFGELFISKLGAG